MEEQLKLGAMNTKKDVIENKPLNLLAEICLVMQYVRPSERENRSSATVRGENKLQAAFWLWRHQHS